jgi:hypothetical protein
MLLGHLRDRVDAIPRPAPANGHGAAVDVSNPVAAGTGIPGQAVCRMRQFHNVQACVGQMPCDRRQVSHEIIERDQMADRVQHGDRQVELSRSGLA